MSKVGETSAVSQLVTDVRPAQGKRRDWMGGAGSLLRRYGVRAAGPAKELVRSASRAVLVPEALGPPVAGGYSTAVSGVLLVLLVSPRGS